MNKWKVIANIDNCVLSKNKIDRVQTKKKSCFLLNYYITNKFRFEKKRHSATYTRIYFRKTISNVQNRPRSTGRFANASSSVASSNVPFRFLLQTKKINDERSKIKNIIHASI